MDEILDDLVRNYNALTPQEVQKFFQSTQYFDRAFVINMRDRVERLKKASLTLSKVNIPFTRFVALDGKVISKDYPWIAKRFDILRPGELGCLLSHLAIIHLASKHPNQDGYTLIFEDDIITSSGADAMKTTLSQIAKISKMEDDGLVYMGKCFEQCSSMTRVVDNIYRAVTPYCCHAYMIRHSFAKILIRDLDDPSKKQSFNKGIDGILADYITKGRTLALVIHPSIFYQDVLEGGSDLRTEFLANYQECNDTYSKPPSLSNLSKTHKTLLVASFSLIFGGIFLFWWFGMKKVLKMAPVLIVFAIVFGLLFVLERNEEFSLFIKTYPTLQTPTSRPNTFQIPESALLNKKYVPFNPNGIILDGKIILATRMWNEEHSYPVLQELDSNFNPTKTVIVHLDDDKPRYPAKTGFEDMRVFSHNGNLHMIGVNIDRNPSGNPSVVWVPLSQEFKPKELIYLKYEPLSHLPNKNWAPITLPNGELCFVVNIDPLLIVKHEKDGVCSKVFEGEKKLGMNNLRCSSIVYTARGLPMRWQRVFGCDLCFGEIECTCGHHHPVSPTRTKDLYIMLAHTRTNMKSKFVYHHYFVKFHLPSGEIMISKPFNVENDGEPHIEYISGFFFPGEKMVITYGLHDEMAKYIMPSEETVRNLMAK